MEHWNGRVEAEASDSPGRHNLHSGSPHIQRVESSKSPHLPAILEPDGDRSRINRTSSECDEHSQRARTLLRLDAFLGEWLSPDYFENITPPPGSKMMLASAKADLLRPEDPIETAIPAAVNQGNFPGGWKSKAAPEEPLKPAMPGLDSMSELRQALPKLGRANSHSLTGAKKGARSLAGRFESERQVQKSGYVPPTPAYAVSPAQAIPQGFVKHARDACVNIDYQWDSMRPPLDWGNGGEYGEEWSAMHRRFRKGLYEMVSWYRNHGICQQSEESDMEGLHQSKSQTEGSEDDTDTVLILVTHGAGCNALVGALTNQPVLIDVGMASLTMAVRKTVDYRRVPQPDSDLQRTRRKSSMDSATSDEYDVKLIASMDHLRPGSQFLGSPPVRPRSPSLPVREKSPYRYERHVGLPNHTGKVSSQDGHKVGPLKEEGSFEEKTSNVKTPITNSGGLWSKPVAKPVDHSTPADATRIFIPRPEASEQARPVSTSPDPGPRVESSPVVNGDHQRSVAQHGLWGAEPKAVGAERDQTMLKRRWTLTQA